MKRQWLPFSRRYQAALQRYLQRGPEASAHAARRIGRQAIGLGLKAHELARIHRMALAARLRPGDSSSTKERAIEHAGTFLFEAITSFETDRIGTKSAAPSDRQKTLLKERTTRLVAANRRLKRGVVQHKTAQDALEKSKRHYAKLLRESDQLQKHLRHLTHRLLSAQEAERKKVSHELHDGVAQTLLGINVRLLTLKKAANGNVTMLRKEIASTQKVVEESVKAINRFACEFETHRLA